MTLPIIRKILMIVITTIWIVHFTIMSLPFVRVMSLYGVNEWCEFFYNIVSVMIVFYATAYFMKQWLNRFSIMTFIQLPLYKKIFYFANKHVLKILSVAVIYVAVSLVLDNEVFGQYHYKDFPFQFERRLSRVHSYALAGPLYALIAFLLRILINRIRMVETENNILKQDMFEIKNLYIALKKETAQN